MRSEISQTKVCKAVARGPGSVFGESEALRVAHTGDYKRAADMLEAHYDQLSKQAQRWGLGRVTVQIWRRAVE